MVFSPEIKRRVLEAGKKFTVSMCVFLALLLIVEGVLRVTHALGARLAWTEPDEIIGWRHSPGARYWYFKENDHPITGTINRFGWRDDEWAINRPDGVFRIAVIGDSYVEAFQVESERTFLELAEKELNQSSRLRYEFMNFGRSGFSQAEELLVLEREVLRFSPDLVILLFLPSNDIDDITPETSSGRDRPFFRVGTDGELILDSSFNDSRSFKAKTRINWFKQRSALVSLAAQLNTEFQIRRLLQKRRTADPPHPDYSPLRGYLSLCTNRPDPLYVASFDLNKLLIRRMSESCRNLDTRFLLVCIDDTYVPEVVEHCRSIDPSFDPGFFERHLESFARTISVDFLGLQSVFQKRYDFDGVPLHFGGWDLSALDVHNGHWNYHGHEVVAEAIVSKLRSEDIRGGAR